jgi:hypothetical protein
MVGLELLLGKIKVATAGFGLENLAVPGSGFLLTRATLIKLAHLRRRCLRKRFRTMYKVGDRIIFHGQKKDSGVFGYVAGLPKPGGIYTVSRAGANSVDIEEFDHIYFYYEEISYPHTLAKILWSKEIAQLQKRIK